ncbi:unnamed protein product [Vitrella brassicaformis CCMP3155]|uniref:Lactate permease n=1 Tax=Vitrella brassicaformis (strain CCMP3155) TaxID=1169540 RepID=A0A0G4GQ09_VITBC|nr:unnamed protein product [Vitrella brassicaformis CCMP3155]|mmetsp:Transcript_41202/g.102873  ORF Transcript_41202/g.102873 Transcript_41202/m.102873 type:complete len:722 (-) Transcript_41202:317-2482(-)|eukprot:CEM32465.1 unnamed protein product [Vitrella brassicaformis CCMP3155]
MASDKLANSYEWMMDYPGVQTMFYLMPIVFLLVVTLKPKGMASYTSLPLSALMLYLIRLVLMRGVDYDSPNILNAAVVKGLLEPMTPVSIIFGAMMLFRTMSETRCMTWMVRMLKSLSEQHPIAEVMLIGWAFGYVVEGASGFGTPTALAAPILAELGHDPVKSIVCCLIMNGVPNVFGAVGTPVWFGFSTVTGIDPELNPDQDEDVLPVVARKTQTLVMLCSVVVPFIACSVLVPRAVCIKNLGFIVASSLACTVTSYCFAWGPAPLFEFGSLVGGIVGFCITVALIYFRIGLFAYRHGDAVKDPEQGLARIPEMVPTEPQGDQKEAVKFEDVEAAKPPKEIQQIEEGVHEMSPMDANVDQADGQQQPEEEEEEIIIRDAPYRRYSQGETILFHRDAWTQAGHALDRASMPQLFDQEEAMKFIQTGMSEEVEEALQRPKGWEAVREAVENTFPIWGTVLLLILIRVSEIGIKDELIREEPYGDLPLGGLGTFRIAQSVTIFLVRIFAEPTVSFRFQTFYVPFIIPFVVVSLAAMYMFRHRLDASPLTIFKETAQRMVSPIVALMGALVLVQLLQIAPPGFDSPATIVGSTLAGALDVGWVFIAPILGALGSFFSGSTTVSNLTFGDIHRVAACELEMSVTSFLALQCLGSALGNMICIHNVLAARTVLGVEEPEGVFIKMTAIPAAIYYAIGTAFGAMLVFATPWWGDEDSGFKGTCVDL